MSEILAPPEDSARELTDFSSSDGSLTVKGFSVAARSSSDKWKIHNQSFAPWNWVPLINRTLLVSNKEEGYLSLEKITIFTSREEHPYLNTPWFKLHPCGTEEWIKLLSEHLKVL